MDILIVMCIGVLIGNRIFPEKYKRLNEKLQVICTVLLIFSMGVTLGQRDNFLHELTSLGFTSFLFFFIPTVLSILLVFILTRIFMERKNKEKTIKNTKEES